MALLAGGVFVAFFAATWWVAPRLGGAPSPAAEAPPRVDAKLKPGGRPLTAAERRAADRLEDDQSLAIVGRLRGRDFPPELVEAARKDGPPSKKYVRFASFDAGGGWTTTCAAAQGEEKGEVVHFVRRYSATAADDDGDNMPALAQYVSGGCAAAMRDHGTLMTYVQYLQKTSAMLPKTKAYDKERLEIIELIRNVSGPRR